MRNPKFWQLPSEKNHPAKITLQPVGFLYSQIVKLRLKFSHSEHIGKPVICVGNFTVGGRQDARHTQACRTPCVNGRTAIYSIKRLWWQ